MPDAPTGTCHNSSTPLIDNFHKSMKRDQSLFPVLTNEHKQNKFLHEMEAQAAAQDVEEILDSSFTPRADCDSQVLFSCKQKFMFAVFQRSLKTDKSQSIPCSATDKNAKRIWAALKTHMIDSTAAQLDEDELLQHVINS